MAVFVLDKRKQPLMPCSEKRARRLLTRGRAVVVRRYPFTIRLTDRVGGAAAVNAARRALYEVLADTGLPVEASSGGRTRYTRARLGIAKTRALDAACVGKVATLVGRAVPTLEIKASGRGDYCRTKLAAHWFARGYCLRSKAVRGVKTGDVVRAGVTNGKKAGVNVGRAKYCKILHRADGHGYGRRPALSPRPERRGFQRGGF